MSKLNLLPVMLVGCLAGCGSPPPPTSPAEDPSLGEPEVVEPEASEPEATESEASEPEATEPEAEPKPTEPEDPCAGAPKKRCQVLQGCAWSDQGKGACVPHRE